MLEQSPKQQVKSPNEKSAQELADKEFMTFAVRLLAAMEIERHLEHSFEEYGFFTELDNYLSDLDEALLKSVEDFRAERAEQ